jgi:hypothetical protein
LAWLAWLVELVWLVGRGVLPLTVARSTPARCRSLSVGLDGRPPPVDLSDHLEKGELSAKLCGLPGCCGPDTAPC